MKTIFELNPNEGGWKNFAYHNELQELIFNHLAPLQRKPEAPGMVWSYMNFSVNFYVWECCVDGAFAASLSVTNDADPTSMVDEDDEKFKITAMTLIYAEGNAEELGSLNFLLNEMKEKFGINKQLKQS